MIAAVDQTELSDAELLRAWRDSDSRAGAALFKRHYPSVLRFFSNKVDATAIEDLVQQTFLALIEGQERFRGDSSIRTFLFAIAHNKLRNHYRSRSRSHGQVDFLTSSAHDLSPGPSSMVAKREEERLLLEALRRIPVEYQVMLELHYWEHQSMAEIAEIVGIPNGTVKTRLRRGKALLGECLRAIGESGEVLERTLSDLEAWARGVRDGLPRPG